MAATKWRTEKKVTDLKISMGGFRGRQIQICSRNCEKQNGGPLLKTLCYRRGN